MEKRNQKPVARNQLNKKLETSCQKPCLTGRQAVAGNQILDMRNHKKLFLFLFLVSGICSLLSLGGCGKKEAATKEEIIPVRVMKAELQNIYETLDYVDDIKAEAEILVYPKVGGKIIEKLKEDGSVVKKGDIIVYIDRDEVGFKFEKAPVESPIDGIIGRIYVDIGTKVSVESPIAFVVNMENVHINLDIPGKYLPKISVGENAFIKVDSYPDEEFKGIVTKVSPVLDLETRTAPIEINIDNKGHRLQSGMFAKVSLILREHKNVPVILREGILGKVPNEYVYVIEDNKAIFKKIVTGIHQGPHYEVKEGLKEGDIVVIMGQQRLYDGAPVAAEE